MLNDNNQKVRGSVTIPGRLLDIDDAKRISLMTGYEGILIIAMHPDGKFQMASYGKTKKQCNGMAELFRQIHERLESGDIMPGPEFVEG